MLNQLKIIFPSLIEAYSDAPLDTDQYNWYTTEDNTIIGIANIEITEKDRLLLETFLTPYHANQAPGTEKEKLWMQILFDNQSTTTMENLPYRFIFFAVSDTEVDPSAFREAIQGLFPSKVSILWENNHEGVIIEEITSAEDDPISFDQIIDVLMSDFYMKVHLFISPTYKHLDNASRDYQWGKQCFHLVLTYSQVPVIRYVDALPYLLLDPISKVAAKTTVDSILSDTVDDEELLKTIEVFLTCNSNATLAAKQLYMHRNSLQYRVDKFIEKTGIDVKQFNGALTVYLTLLLRKMK
ncbi:PucR family transcriptional regulator [Radiobacillus sp. PE A8.2]|uniref:PucR family transcriptional regulator n=1 Tax=Radiobacillus sp. PE A8.2 TaxID=3380349 RepID=UPI00388E556A